MPDSPPHQLHTAPGVRLWLAPAVQPEEMAADWLQRGEKILADRAAAAGAVLGEGRGLTHRVGVGGLAGVWRLNRHGGMLGSIQGDRYRSPARLATEIQLSESLRACGVLTPPVLLGLAVKHGLAWRQHLVTEEVPGAITVFAAREDSAALAAADSLLNQLCEVGLWATDLHPANMLWQPDSESCWVIDLAGAKLLNQPLSSERRQARRQRFARYFAKHGGQIPELFCG